MKAKKITVFTFIIIISLFLLKALFTPGFFTSHDGPSHLSRVAQYTLALQDGQFPPRWAGGLQGGLGYPIFVYSYHLPFLLASAFHLVGLTIVSSVKILLLLSYALSGFGMYLFLKESYKKIPSLVGALFYMLFPYRFILIFVRAALGEALSFGVLPFLLWALIKAEKTKEKSWIVISGFMLFLAITSHTLFLTTYLPVVLLYFIFFRGEKIKKNFSTALKALALGLLASSFMLLPQIFERGYVRVNDYFQNNAVKHLLSVRQLIRSPWGYGFSHPGVADDAMSFQVGLVHMLITLIFLALLLAKKISNKDKKRSVFWLLVMFTSAFLMVDSSVTRWLWENILLYTAVDIPWRLLGVVGLAISIIAAQTTSIIVGKKAKLYFSVGIVALLLYTNRNHLRINQSVVLSDEQIYSMHDTTTYLNEFKPSWRGSSGVEKIDQKVVSLTGSDSSGINILSNKSNLLRFETDFEKASQININTLYFPGWSLSVENESKTRDLNIGKGYLITSGGLGIYSPNQTDGTINLYAPTGKHIYELRYEETPIRALGNIVSGVTILGMLITYSWLKIKKYYLQTR